MEKLYVLYDARCGLCSWAKRWLMQQPAIVHLSFIPAGSVLAGRLFPGLCQPGDPEEELVVVSDEGGVYREGNAWIMCLFALEEYRDWANRNTVEIGASHGLLLSWVWEPTRYQGGCDYDATRTMHAAARCDGPVLGSIDGTGTDYPARGRSPSACGHRPNQSTPLYADPRSRLLGGAGHGNLDRAADPPSLQARTPASLRRGDPSSVQPVRGPTTSGHRPGPPPV